MFVIGCLLLCAKHRCCCVSFDVVIVALLLFDANDVDVTDVCISVVAMQSDVAVIAVVVVVILPDELLEEKNVDVQLDALEVLFELYVQH